jgi:hypothetical protein
MTANPFEAAPVSIPVTLVTSGEVPPAPEAALLTLDAPLHRHPPGHDCPACAARVDIRAMLFDLMTEMQLGTVAPFRHVVIDARALPDVQPVLDRLDPLSPAVGLRDHTVARSFHLSRVI